MTKGNATGTASVRAAIVVAALVVAALIATVAMAGSHRARSTSDAARATAKFHELTSAKDAGYGLLKDKNGISCIAMDEMPGMGAMGIHYAKSSLVADGAIDVSAPEALVYAPEAGKLHLAAVEYLVLKSAWDAKHASTPSLFGHQFNL